MFDYFLFKSVMTLFFALPLTFTGTSDTGKFFQRLKIALAPSKNTIETQRERLREYLPTDEKRAEIWSYIFSKKQEFSICNHKGVFFDREVEENREKKYFEKNRHNHNVFRIKENKFFVEVNCSWASYQGGFEYFTYEKSDEVILNRLILRRFSSNEDGSLAEVYDTSVVGIPKFDPANKTLTVFTRAGGGDCGSYLAEYKYEDDALKLLVLRQNYECIKHEGVYNPEQYPIIYSAADK